MLEGDPLDEKWYLSWEEYPFDTLPNYASGMTAFYSSKAVRELYFASAYVKHLEVDDMYVGIVAAKLGLELTNLDAVILDFDYEEPQLELNTRRQLISWHIPENISQRQAIWDEILDSSDILMPK